MTRDKNSKAQEWAERREARAQEKAERREERAQEKERKRSEDTPLSAEERFENYRSTIDPEAEREKLNDQERRRRIHSFLRTEYAKLSSYVILTFVVIYLIQRIGDHLPAILSRTGTVIGTAGSLLTPLILGFVLAYLLYPLKDFFYRKLQSIKPFKENAGRCQTASVVLTMVLTIGAVILLLSVIISAIGHQVRMVSVDDLGDFVAALATSLNEIYVQMQQRLAEISGASEELSELADSLTSWVGSFTSSLGASLTGSLSNITGFFSNLLFAIIFAIYFLIDTEGLAAYWDRVLRSVSSRRFYRSVHLLLQDADTVFSGYIRGQIIDALIMFIMVSAALSIMNIQFAIIIGIMTGIGNLIPYVGPFIAYGSTVIVCMISGDWQKLVISLIVLLIIQTVDGNVINPRLLSSSINIHPMLVIVALTVGSRFGGIVGMLVAVPTAGLIKIWFDRLIGMLLEYRNAKREEEMKRSS